MNGTRISPGSRPTLDEWLAATEEQRTRWIADGIVILGMTHAPNTIKWKRGDIVVHDADAKRPDMLMIVLGCSRKGIYRTRYAFPRHQPKAWRRKVWRNAGVYLHDPERFGMLRRPAPASEAQST